MSLRVQQISKLARAYADAEGSQEVTNAHVNAASYRLYGRKCYGHTHLDRSTPAPVGRRVVRCLTRLMLYLGVPRRYILAAVPRG